MDEGTRKELCVAGRIRAFSVSSSNISAVIKYIDKSGAHHRRSAIEDEFITLLKKHKIAFDPKYVFGLVSPPTRGARVFTANVSQGLRRLG